MEYESCYNTLWRSLECYSSDKKHAVIDDQLLLQISTLSRANDITIEKRQWIESLAVVSCLAVDGYKWSTTDRIKWANDQISIISKGLGLDSDCQIDCEIFKSIVDGYVKPYFVSSKKQTKQQFALIGSDPRQNEFAEFGEQKWKSNLQCLGSFTWALNHLKESDTTLSISYILPVVLDLTEDYECEMKVKGLDMVHTLANKLDNEFMIKSGIGELLEKSTLKCLTYRSEEKCGAKLLSASFQTIIEITRILYHDKSNKRYASAWWNLAEQIVNNQIYVSDNVEAGSILCKQISPLCDALGPAIARYIRPLLGDILHRLQSPVYYSQNILDLHLIIVQQINSLIDACEPRIAGYALDIIASLAYSWSSAYDKRSGNLQGIDELNAQLYNLVLRIYRTSPDKIENCITRLYEARPDEFEKWKSICQ